MIDLLFSRGSVVGQPEYWHCACQPGSPRHRRLCPGCPAGRGLHSRVLLAPLWSNSRPGRAVPGTTRRARPGAWFPWALPSSIAGSSILQPRQVSDLSRLVATAAQALSLRGLYSQPTGAGSAHFTGGIDAWRQEPHPAGRWLPGQPGTRRPLASLLGASGSGHSAGTVCHHVISR